MLRLVSISILTVLLCSCVQKPGLSAYERMVQYEAHRQLEGQLWLNKLEQLPGTHISQWSDLWGEPEKLGENVYHWRKFSPSIKIRDGHYVEDGYTDVDVYEYTDYGRSERVGYIRTPKERYVPPQYASEYLCEIQATTDENGIIINTAYRSEVDGRADVFNCRVDFHFPEE